MSAAPMETWCRLLACAALLLHALCAWSGEARAGSGAAGMDPHAEQESRSPGCGRAPPQEPPDAVRVDDRSREVITAIPEDYDPSTPHALVFAFHGRTNSNARVRNYYDLERHAAAETIFVYPSGLAAANGTYTWSNPCDASDRLRDYALFDELLTMLAQRYCIDLDRVYVVGHSLGGWFANSLACARGDAIRAAAIVGAGVSLSECRGPVAAMIVHNPNDRLVDIGHAVQVRDSYLARNDLSRESIPAEPRGLNCERFGAPDAAHPVLWCLHGEDHTPGGRYYPHQWPRGTGEAMMGFFGSLP